MASQNGKVTLDNATVQSLFKQIKNGDGGAPVGRAKLNEDGSVTLVEKTIDGIRAEVLKDFRPIASEVINQVTEREYDKLSVKVQAELDKYQKMIAENAPIEVKFADKKPVKLSGVRHAKFDTLLRVVQCGQAAMLVGPAGTGKTKAAELVAEALNLTFHAISVGAQTSKSDLQGYMNASGMYVSTEFRKAYESGGLFLLDEADAGNSNVLILLNAALSNGYMAFPDGMVQAHENFRLIASANTFGTGASRQYVGRNQLDAATLDRFTTLFWDIDAKIEKHLAGGNTAWLRVVKTVRDMVEDRQLRVVISPRATKRGAELLAAGLKFDDVLDMALLSHIDQHHAVEFRVKAKQMWSTYNGKNSEE